MTVEEAISLINDITVLPYEIINSQKTAKEKLKANGFSTNNAGGRKKLYEIGEPFQKQVDASITQLQNEFNDFCSRLSNSGIAVNISKLHNSIDELYAKEKRVYDTISTRARNGNLPGGTFRDALNFTKKEQENVIDLCRKTITRLSEMKTQLEINLNAINQNQDVVKQTSQSKVPPVEHLRITENEMDTK